MPTLRQKRQSASSWPKPEREPFGDVVFNLNGSHSSHCKLKISGKNPGRLFYRKQMCASWPCNAPEMIVVAAVLKVGFP